MNKNYLMVFGLVLALVLGGVAVSRPAQVVKEVAVKAGSVASPDLPFPCLSVGGVRRCSGQMSPTQATTTICAIQSPAATSTLVGLGATLTVSSSTASRLVIASSTTAYATTTHFASTDIAANAQMTLVSTSTRADKVISPNTWFVFSMNGGTGTFSPSGSCFATFE